MFIRKYVSHGFSLKTEEVDVQNRWLTRANAWTLSGVLSIICYVYMYLTGTLLALIPIVFVYGVGLSDLLDGMSAKKHNAHTHQGAILDPVRDRLGALAFLGNFVWLEPLSIHPSVVVLLLILTESYISLKNFMLNVEVHAVGKIRQSVHVVAGGLFLAQTYWGMYWPVNIPSLALLWIMLLASCVAFLFYRQTAYSRKSLGDLNIQI